MMPLLPSVTPSSPMRVAAPPVPNRQLVVGPQPAAAHRRGDLGRPELSPCARRWTDWVGRAVDEQPLVAPAVVSELPAVSFQWRYR